MQSDRIGLNFCVCVFCGKIGVFFEGSSQFALLPPFWLREHVFGAQIEFLGENEDFDDFKDF